VRNFEFALFSTSDSKVFGQYRDFFLGVFDYLFPIIYKDL
jgi:hypothetical protein